MDTMVALHMLYVYIHLDIVCFDSKSIIWCKIRYCAIKNNLIGLIINIYEWGFTVLKKVQMLQFDCICNQNTLQL